MKPNRTPGPWSYDEEYGKVLDASGRTISVSGVSIPCGHVPPHDESHANARMLAAAPEMLEALRMLNRPMIALPPDTWMAVWSAIAKATGKTIEQAKEEAP